MKKLLLTERVLLVSGGVLLAVVAIALGHRWFASNQAFTEFDQAQAELAKKPGLGNPLSSADDDIDFSLWSDKRIHAYRESLQVKTEMPMGVITVARLHVRAPIFEGTDDLVLNRGVGWIPGTGLPGALGDSNVGLAGHRDGFFRAFKDVKVGDAVELATLEANHVYEVDSLEIVKPEDVHVLLPRGVPSLTLVTCYPFYFIGDAPQRLIVHATLKQLIKVAKQSSDSIRQGSL